MRLFVPFIVFLLVLGTGTSIVISPSKIVDYQDPPVIQTYTEGELYLVANSDLSSIEVTVLKTLQNIEYSIIRLDSSISTNVQLWPNIALQLDTGEIDTQLEDYHEQIGTEEVWSMNYTGDGIVIAVVDTGVNFNHPALQGKMVAEQSFHNETYGYQTSKGPADDNGHGTSVASLVAGHEPGRFQSAAYNASIVSAKLGVENGYITSLSLIGALDWVVSLDYVDIITMSLSEPEENYDIDPLEEMANLAASKGKFVFGSAGNRGSFGRDPYSMGSPGTAPEAISVGAVTDMGNLASFSSEGPSYGNHPKPDVLAPGVGIETAERSGGYRSRSGTSFSTPIAASVAAVVLQAANENGISLTPAGMKATLLGSSRDLGLPYYQQGFGLLNLTGAVIDLPNLSQESLVSPRGGTLPAIELPAETPVYLPLTVISDHQVIDISAASEGISISYDPIYLGNTSTFRLEIQSSILFADSVIDISIDLEDDQVTYSLPVEVLEKPEYTVLVDLKHTVLDNILAAPVNAPLERIGLRDLERYTNYIRDNNGWVTEFFGEELTYEILSEYDLVVIPSAFSFSLPSFYDHRTESTELGTNEFFALYEYYHNGGSILIDFDGETKLDNSFEFSQSFQSRELMLSLLGVTGQYRAGVPILRSSINEGIVDETEVISGKFEFNHGQPVISGENGYSSIAQMSENGGKIVVHNDRNWRTPEGSDITYMANITSWLTSNSLVESADKSPEGIVYTFSNLIDTNNLEIEVTIDGINSDYAINGNQLIISKDSSERAEIEIRVLQSEELVLWEIAQLPAAPIFAEVETDNPDQIIYLYDEIVIDLSTTRVISEGQTIDAKVVVNSTHVVISQFSGSPEDLIVQTIDKYGVLYELTESEENSSSLTTTPDTSSNENGALVYIPLVAIAIFTIYQRSKRAS